MEIAGLKSEIAKGEFTKWSMDDLSKFVTAQTRQDLPSLEHPSPRDLRLLAAVHYLKQMSKGIGGPRYCAFLGGAFN